MSSKTTNYELHKIDLTDAPPDITVLNQNWDTLDTELKNTVDAITDAIDNHDDDTAAHYSIRNAMMPKAGGTMTGNLKISKANSPTIELQVSNSNGYTNIYQHGGTLTINSAMSNSSDDSFLTMSKPSDGDDDSDLFRIGKSVNNVNYYYKLYGEHNKPTAGDVGAAITNNYTATIPTTGWSSSAPYSVNVTVSGLLATDNPVVDVVLSSTADTAKAQLEAWGKVGRIVTAANSITVYCYEEVPTTAIPIQLKVVR